VVIGDSKGKLSFTDADLHLVVQGELFSPTTTVVLLAKSRQNPPLFVVIGEEETIGATPSITATTTTTTTTTTNLVLKTWLGSSVKAPLHSIDLAAQAKVSSNKSLEEGG